ncbi:MAG: phycobilisome protein [Cyanobacteria bacterium J06641_5]
MNFQLSARAKELIPKARIVSFATWSPTYPEVALAALQAADDEGRYLTDADLIILEATAIPSAAQLAAARLLRDRASEIVTAARKQVLANYPGIAEPGGSLYPAVRAEACWRDFWHFLRCITYGIAGGQLEFMSAEGLHYMNLLYQELRVPLEAMVSGLEALKLVSVVQLEPLGATLPFDSYFDRPIASLRAFH